MEREKGLTSLASGEDARGSRTETGTAFSLANLSGEGDADPESPAGRRKIKEALGYSRHVEQADYIALTFKKDAGEETARSAPAALLGIPSLVAAAYARAGLPPALGSVRFSEERLAPKSGCTAENAAPITRS